MELTNSENSLFEKLLSANEKEGCGSTIRVAGGWVRDKILGRQSDDIDVTIDNISGLEFARSVARYLGCNDSVGVIPSNPEKSKHIETAVLKIDNYEVQFTGFRKESYNDNSRIPKVEIGDLSEETYRRDFTINSLYYNLNTGEIEDISGQGIDDIQNRIIRLMVPTRDMWSRMGINDDAEANIKSITDDPLRLLRAVRFATRFGFDIDESVVSAASDPGVINSFIQKISRERMQIEFRKIMSGPNPHRALMILRDWGLFDIILPLPSGYMDWDMDQNTIHHSMNIWNHTMTALENIRFLAEMYNISTEDTFIISLAILLHDVGKLNPNCHGVKRDHRGTRTTYYDHEKHSIFAIKDMLVGLPGIKNSEIKRVCQLVLGSSRANPMYTSGHNECNLSRKSICKFVRFMGEDWKLALVVSLADATAKKRDGLHTFGFTYHSNMMDRIRDIGPQSIIDMRTMLDGEEISEIVGVAPGPWLGRVVKRLLEWQFQNPEATKKDAENYIRSFRGIQKIDTRRGKKEA